MERIDLTRILKWVGVAILICVAVYLLIAIFFAYGVTAGETGTGGTLPVP